jgi:hypothetical protein
MITTDADERPLLEIRTITITGTADGTPGSAGDHA